MKSYFWDTEVQDTTLKQEVERLCKLIDSTQSMSSEDVLEQSNRVDRRIVELLELTA